MSKQPKSPLPWNFTPPIGDEEYIVHACNAYPKLIATLSSYNSADANLPFRAYTILKELGELE